MKKNQSLIKIWKQKISDPYVLILLIILIIAFFFRFYNFPNRYGFDYDAARDSLVSLAGARHLWFPLVGPPASVGSFTFGPWYYYQIIIATIIFPFGYAPWISMGIISTIIVFVMYKIGVAFENKFFGIILAVLSAFATSQIVLSTNLSNPDPVSLCTAFMLLMFILFLKQKKTLLFTFLWGLVFGLGLLYHYQMVWIIAFPVLAIVYKREKILFYFLSFFLGIFLPFLPLVVFEFSHHFQITNAIIYYVIHGTSNPVYIPNSWKIYLFQFWPGFWASTLGVETLIGTVIAAGSGLMFLLFGLQKKLNRVHVLFIFGFLINVILFRYYNGQRSVYYLYFLQPFVIIFTGYFIFFVTKLPFGKYLSITVLCLLLFLIYPQDKVQLNTLAPHTVFANFTKLILSENNNKPVILYNCGNYARNRIYAATYILSLQNKISVNGTKIGIFDPYCREIAMKTVNDPLNRNKIKRVPFLLSEFDMIYLSSYDNATLTKMGWLRVTPESVYNNIAVTLDNK